MISNLVGNTCYVERPIMISILEGDTCYVGSPIRILILDRAFEMGFNISIKH